MLVEFLSAKAMRTEDSHIAAELERARKRLLDLSLRNRLLNFRPTKRTTIEVVHEVPDVVFQQLVIDQTQMYFKHVSKLPETADGEAKVAKDEIDFSEETQNDKWLQTDLTRAALEPRLLQIKLKSDTVFEEQGYTVLYLALGFLEWKDKQDSDLLHRAPLVLIPTMLTRKSVGSAFRLKWTEEDLTTNVSLQAKLDDFGVKLPEFVLPDDPQGTPSSYFKKVKRAISKQVGWNISNDIYLGFFSFNKFVMWRDLTPQDKTKEKNIVRYPLLRSLFEGDINQGAGDALSSTDFSEDEQKVAMLPVKNQYHVMDADASQVAVIEAVKAGKNLVVEGPPGTGKSQTITNVIAELLALGRKVLFVSEKMAALEVVKSRLDLCGLGDACLELHSRYSNKRLVLEELKRTIEIRPPAPVLSEQKFDERERLAQELNSYAEVLRSEVGESKRTPFSLFGQYVRARHLIEERGHKLHYFNISGVERISESEYERVKRGLNDLSEIIPALRPIASNPWRHCHTSGRFFDIDRDEVNNLILDSKEAIDAINSAALALDAIAGTGTPSTVEQSIYSINAASFMAEAPAMVEAKLLMDDRWNKVSPSAAKLISRLEFLQDRVSMLEGRWSIPFSIQAVHRFASELKDQISLLKGLRNSLVALSEQAGCFHPSSLQEAKYCVDAALTVANGLPAESDVLLNAEWNQENPTATLLIEAIELLQSEKTELELLFKQEAFICPIEDLRREFELQSQSALFFIRPKFWILRKQALSLHKSRATIPQLLRNLNRLAQYMSSQELVINNEENARSLFGLHWQGQSSNVRMLRSFSKWIVQFRQSVMKGYLTERAISVASDGPDKEHLKRDIDESSKLLRQVSSSLAAVCGKLDVDNLGLADGHLENKAFLELESALETWIRNLAMLEQWIAWRQQKGFGEITKLRTQMAGLNAEARSFVADYEVARCCIEERDFLQEKAEEARYYFGRLWLCESTSVNILRAFSDWATEFRKYVSIGTLTLRSAAIVESGINPNAISDASKNMGASIDRAARILNTLEQRIGFTPELGFGKPWNETEYDVIKGQLQDWIDNLHLLAQWAQFVQYRNSLNNSSANEVIDLLERDKIDPADAVLLFELNFAASLLRMAFNDHPALDKFIAEVHERRIVDFAAIDKELQRLNQQRLARLIYEARPQPFLAGSVPQSELGILQGELNKKKRHLSIRRLLSFAGRLIQQLKPCFLMSPLSIAQFLEMQTIEFDTVIFDEASQVGPEDALGALLRAKQLIVMGDTKQLPPTSFFDKIDSEDEADDENFPDASIKDIESILQQCVMRFPQKMLRWHYRSRHESLIEVSNRTLYGNKLLIYPSVAASLPGVGLEHIESKGSVYDRGKSAKNREEAKMVVDAAIEHYRKNPEKSLGIGTFSIQQQEAILDEIERVLRINSELQDYFYSKSREKCFVKNLETIQGDERDVIFISVGYGKDSNGRLTSNFGPINREGGERRLNVLMTRARERCVIFSNFRAEDLPIDNNASRGVKILKQFLEFARSRRHFTPTEMSADTESPFEDSVKSFLEACGHEVRTQVGCAEFRIDLAVVNPEYPGCYLLAVECDGRKYHTTSVARDRDRLRQQVLEEMGWRGRIHRIWSTDWFHNYPVASKRLLEAIDKARTLPLNLGVATKNEGQLLNNNYDPVIRIEKEPALIDNYEAAEYLQCTAIKARISPNLYDSVQSELAIAVADVVEVESPVHFEEIVTRLRTIAELGKAGSRIRSAIKFAAALAERKEMVRRKGSFFWRIVNDRPAMVRRRPKEMLKAERIAEEEISAAFERVLEIHFATPEEQLIKEAARLLGFQAIREATSKRFQQVLKSEIKKGVFRINGQQMVEIVSF